MNIKQILLFVLTLLTISCQPKLNKVQSKTNEVQQNKIYEIESKSIDYYHKQINKLEKVELIKQKIYIDSSTISPKYKDEKTNRFNENGYKKYLEINKNIYKSFSKDYIYKQKIEFNNDFYVLYFTIDGSDAMEWSIIKMNKDSWKGKDKLSKKVVEENPSIERILFYYDERGEWSIDNIQIFIHNNYLLIDYSPYYHSLYDLKNQIVLVNRESPWPEDNSGEEFNELYKDKESLHNKIQQIILKK